MYDNCAPSSRRATADQIKDWIATQRPLVEVVDAIIPALGLGEPRIVVGPKFYPRESGLLPAHLRRGAVWFVGRPVTNTGFRVEFYGPRLRISAWGQNRTCTIDSTDVEPGSFAKDLWVALQVARLAPTSAPLPMPPVVDDGHGNVWFPCRPGCDLQVVRPGKAQCSCPDNMVSADR